MIVFNVFCVVGHKERTSVRLCKVEADTVESYVLCVTDIKSFGGNRSEHPGFGIYFLLFGWSALAVFFAVSTFIIYMNVAESNIFDRCTGDTADNGRIPAVSVPYIDVADQNTLHGAYGCPFRTAHTRTQAKEDRSIDDIPHGDIADNDVFQMAAVYGFERQSPTMFEDTVGEDDVAEASAAFRSELDASGTVSMVGGLWFVELPAAVQYASLVESADVAVADGNVLRIFETSQRIRGFQNDGVIPRGVDRALADAYVAAAVNVESVPVGIYFQIKQGEVLYTGGKQGEVSAMPTPGRRLSSRVSPLP